MYMDTESEISVRETEKISPVKRHSEYENTSNYTKRSLDYAHDKVQMAEQTHNIMVTLIHKLDLNSPHDQQYSAYSFS